jgi:hypothetical protein
MWNGWVKNKGIEKLTQEEKDSCREARRSTDAHHFVRSSKAEVLLYWSNPVSQVLRAMAVKRTTRGRSNFGELMTVKIY